MAKNYTLETILEQSFLDYSAFILQRRAIPDARDGMKYTARQILHAQKREKLDAKHPYKKSQKSVSAATAFSYVHGDTSCYEQIIRMGRNMVQRYFLESIKGNSGPMTSSNSYSAPRYTEARLAPLADEVMKYMNQDVLSDRDWSPTYDEEGVFPLVFPSVGFNNLCNGSFGSIGVGLISSIPQFNLTEMNEAICALIDNPDAEVNLLPDFASGGILLNPQTTAASLAKGEGKSALIRSHIKKYPKEGYLEVVDLPYGVYTNTICSELAKELEKKDALFTEFKDLTQACVQIRIHSKDLDKLEKWLYKNTSVQKHFTIKLIMLHNGTTPKLFSLKQALLEHVTHTKSVYRKHFEYELKQLKDRLEIIDGLIRAHSILDEVIACIKRSSGRANVIVNLRNDFQFTEQQATAIADLRLHRLSNLDIQQLNDERLDNLSQQEFYIEILENEELFNDHLKGEYIGVAEEFGDKRRTEIAESDLFESCDGGKATKPFFFAHKGDRYVAAYSKDDEVFESIDKWMQIDPELEYTIITNMMRGFTRQGSEITLGEMKYSDIMKMNDGEFPVFITPKNMLQQLEFAIITTASGDQYSLHTSFFESASKRGKKIVSGKYIVTDFQLSETSMNLPKLK